MEERLQKLIAQAGIASRRAAEELIRKGEVTVNGEVVTELGTKANPAKDHIKVNGKLINLKLEKREKVYVLLYKPRGYLSSVSDPDNRPLVTDLVPESLGKVYPVGRLDFNTEGLILLTNDGDLTNFITQAKNRIPKIYEAKVKGIPPEALINKLRRGTILEDGFKTAPAEVTLVEQTDTNAWYEVILREGHNQQIRKMFDAIGHSVIKLKRVRIGHLTIGRLPTGAYILLDEEDIKPFYKPSTLIVTARKEKPKMPKKPRNNKPAERNNQSTKKPRARIAGIAKKSADAISETLRKTISRKPRD